MLFITTALKKKTCLQQNIISILQTKSKDRNIDWHYHYPHMHARLELILFSKAQSIDEYANLHTLKERIKDLVALGEEKVPFKAPIEEDNEEELMNKRKSIRKRRKKKGRKEKGFEK